VKGPATFYGSVTAHASGPAGFVRVIATTAIPTAAEPEMRTRRQGR